MKNLEESYYLKTILKLLETIRFENGKFENLEFHQKRMNASRKALFGCKISFNLPEVLHQHLTDVPSKGLFKCRLIYSTQIEKVELMPYFIPRTHSLKIVSDDHISYAYKFFDRTAIDKLYKQKSACDDILIVKNGLITDTSYANILFFNGKEWITPEKPLLNGIQRGVLLEKEMIKTADIRLEDLHYFEKARLVNAMIRFEDELVIRNENIS